MLKQSDLKNAFSQLGRVMRNAPDGAKLYRLKDGELSAASSGMIGGIPIDTELEFCVQGEAFEKAVGALSGDIKVEVGNRTLQLIAGKTRLALPRQDADLLRERPSMDGGVATEPDGHFKDLAKQLTGLVHEARNPDWQSSMMISRGHMIAMNKGMLMACAKYDIFDGVKEALLPIDLVDIILAKKAPMREMVFGDGSVKIDFQDDAWLHGQMISGSIPDKLFDLMSKLTECEVAITKEERDAVAQVLSLDAATVMIEPKRMTADTANGEIVIDVDTHVSRKTCWNAKVLKEAMDLATHWNLGDYPKPGFLSSPKLRLMIASQHV